MFFGCNREENKSKLEADKNQRTIDSLKSIIEKETDRKIFSNAIDLMKDNKNDKAIKKFKELISKFPNSELINESNKNIEICEAQILKIEDENVKELEEIIRKAKKVETEEAIKLFEEYLKKEISDNLETRANKELEFYKTEYKKVEAERNFEKSTGIKIISCKAEWELDYSSVTPFVRVKVKNISGQSIDNIKIIVQFINKDKGEVMGDNFHYIQSSSDAPFESGYSKESKVTSDKFLSSLALSNLPNLTVKIYFERKYDEKIFFKEISVKKSFGI